MDHEIYIYKDNFWFYKKSHYPLDVILNRWEKILLFKLCVLNNRIQNKSMKYSYISQNFTMLILKMFTIRNISAKTGVKWNLWIVSLLTNIH